MHVHARDYVKVYSKSLQQRFILIHENLDKSLCEILSHNWTQLENINLAKAARKVSEELET
jgi:hypothetical protein